MSGQNNVMLRANERKAICTRAASGMSVSLVGVSNVGKSTFLRNLCQVADLSAGGASPSVEAQFVYIDCNRMVDHSEQAFYELVLRVLMTQAVASDNNMQATLRQHYETLLNPPSDLLIPLSFNRALTAWIDTEPRRCVLIFDEFDAAFAVLDERVLLNLRALNDRYGEDIVILTATDRRLSHIRSGEQLDEFVEMFGPEPYYIKPLAMADIDAFIHEQALQVAAVFDANDLVFLHRQAGGHPSLTEIACRQLAVVTGDVERSDNEDWLIHRQVRDALRVDLSVVDECTKIWRDLTESEHDALQSLFLPGTGHDPRPLRELERKGILVDNDEGPTFFAALFEDFVRRRTIVQTGLERGVRVNADTEEVTVDGLAVDDLTNLEYRLLLLLYGRLNRVCSKYEIVESVWGEDYIDSVYDSSIEKLVSRLRRKIEPDASNPQYLVTVRGRGYKLVG
ncbi:MAG: winged helix-turn-helix domain-containing protein [Caldilineales bacterium]|nr:winged helix-turn-helix domain-containing protein [Caldilineales bacterium]